MYRIKRCFYWYLSCFGDNLFIDLCCFELCLSICCHVTVRSYRKMVTKNNRTSPYPTLCIHEHIPMVEAWTLCMNGETGRKSRHHPLHNKKMAAMKPKLPATWVDCCFLSGKLCKHLHQYEQDLLRCFQCGRMHLQRHEAVSPSSQSNDDTEKSREILHF
jgi:hypothetical protein